MTNCVRCNTDANVDSYDLKYSHCSKMLCEECAELYNATPTPDNSDDEYPVAPDASELPPPPIEWIRKPVAYKINDKYTIPSLRQIAKLPLTTKVNANGAKEGIKVRNTDVYLNVMHVLRKLSKDNPDNKELEGAAYMATQGYGKALLPWVKTWGNADEVLKDYAKFDKVNQHRFTTADKSDRNLKFFISHLCITHYANKVESIY